MATLFSRSWLLALSLGLVTAGAAGLVSAHNGDATQIHSCVNQGATPRGQVIIYSAPGLTGSDPTSVCGTRGTSVDWNAQGIQGPTGPQGLQGIQGPSGPAGAAGAAGASDLYIARGAKDGNYQAPVFGVGDLPLSLTVPAGSYLIGGKTTVFNGDGDPQTTDCTLSTGDISRVRPDSQGNGEQVAVSLADAATFALPTTITMNCAGFGHRTSYSVLTATKVGVLH
jgi:hypothetical protein